MMVLNYRQFKTAVVLTMLLLSAILAYYTWNQPPHTTPPPDPKQDFPAAEYIMWTQADQIFPRYAVATVRDFETGLEFQVQRRAGRYHADVQPLTAVDTTIMKTVYANSWSWRRRGIIVILESGRQLAASMNGMPHGAGAIQNNKFNGHFCIHFRDSKTHASRKSDLAHQIMIWKAAGILEDQLASLEGRQLVEVVFTAIDQGDERIPGLVLAGDGAASFLKEMQAIQSLRIGEVQTIDSLHFQVTAQVALIGVPGTRNCKLFVTIKEHTPYNQILAESLNPLVVPMARAAAVAWPESQATVN